MHPHRSRSFVPEDRPLTAVQDHLIAIFMVMDKRLRYRRVPSYGSQTLATRSALHKSELSATREAPTASATRKPDRSAIPRPSVLRHLVCLQKHHRVATLGE